MVCAYMYASFNFCYMQKGKNMAEVNEATPYDDVFQTEVIECPKLIIPVINEAFHETYDGSETIL